MAQWNNIKQKTISFLLILTTVITNCSKGQKVKIKKESFRHDNKVKELIIDNFINFDERYFTSLDSCAFLYSIQTDTAIYDYKCYSVYGDLMVVNHTDDITKYHYSVIKDRNTSQCFYYGQTDIYELTFNINLRTNILYEFDNVPLNNIISNWIKLNHIKKNERTFEGIKKSITQLYFTPFENIEGVNSLTFSRTVSLRSIVSEYYKGNELIIQHEFPEQLVKRTLGPIEKNVVVFKNEDLGYVIFKIEEKDHSFSIREFILRTITGVGQIRSDTYPMGFYKHCYR
jgi:hypothetical protein